MNFFEVKPGFSGMGKVESGQVLPGSSRIFIILDFFSMQRNFWEASERAFWVQLDFFQKLFGFEIFRSQTRIFGNCSDFLGRVNVFLPVARFF